MMSANSAVRLMPARGSHRVGVGFRDVPIPSVFGIIVYSLFHRVRRNGSVTHRLDGLQKARFEAFRVDIRRRLWYILSTNRKVGFGFGRLHRGESIGGLDACWLIFFI